MNTPALNSIGQLYNQALATLGSLDIPIARSFATDFPSVQTLQIQPLKPFVLPVTGCITQLGKTVPVTAELVEKIKDCYESQQWRQPYAIDDFGEAFFHNIAWFPIADAEGPLVYPHGLMEIMLMGPEVKYPLHRHEPEELYLVLAGQVWWEAEGEDPPCWKRAGEIIHHRPHQAHSIAAGDSPVLILNIWRGGGFEMPSIL